MLTKLNTIFCFLLLFLSSCNYIKANFKETIDPSTTPISIPDLSFTGATGTNGGVGSVMNVVPPLFNDNGSPITNCTISPALPAGLTIDPNTCVISGVPSTPLTPTVFTITVYNSAGSLDATVTLSVSPSTPSLSYAGASGTNGAIGVMMTVSPTTLNSNGSAITNCTASPALPSGLTMNATTCVISGTPSSSLSSTSYTITVVNGVGSTNATVSLSVGATPPSISYSGATGTSGNVGVSMSVSPTTLANNGSSITNCTSSPALPAGLSVNATTCVISGTPSTTAASATYTITATNGAGSSNAAVTLVIAASVPSISYTGATGTSGTVGSGMSVTPTTLSANGAAISNCTSSPALPSGLAISATTCVISGTPTASAASASYTITATNSAGTNTASVTLVVGASAPSISYTGATGTSGNAGTAMTVTPTTLNNNGASITACSSSPALPSGLIINATTCVISGTPTVAAASASYTITVTNSAGSNTGSVTLEVAAAAPVLSYASSTGTSGSVGVAMTVTPTTLTNNGAAITSCTSATTLPTGLSINATTCVISGTPTSPFASASYTITATNSAGSDSDSVTLVVAASAPSLSYVGATGTSGTVGTAMSVSPTTLNNNGASITGCASSPALPAGLSINSSTCIISGTPSAVTSSATYTITATNSAGSTNATVDLSTAAGAPTISYASSTGTVGNAGSSMSVTPSTLSNNGSAITNCVATSALPSGLTINATTCVISGTPPARLSSTSFTITATNGIGSTNATVSLEVGCPAGYIPVDADATLGLPSFCVMKYEAKCGTTIAGTTSCSPSTGVASASKIAVSTVNGNPWVQISGNDAIIACQNLNAIHSVSQKYDILSNTEWIAIARSIEQEPSNWTDVAGIMKLNQGHNDASPAFTCDGTQENVQTNCTTAGTDFHQKRTHTLLNNSEIWDMAGNVWELVDWTVEVPNTTFTIGPSNCQNSFLEIQTQITNCNPNLGTPSPSASSLASPLDISLDSTNNIGRIYGSDNLTQGAAHRGGSFNNDVGVAGIFTLSLNYVPTGSSSNNLGYRCVFRD